MKVSYNRKMNVEIIMETKLVLKRPFILILCFLFIICSCEHQSIKLEKALELAGNNKQELIKVLDHYKELGDDLKYKAALFLIENMPGHGTITSTWINADGKEYDLNILEYPDLETIRHTMDSMGYYQVISPLLEDCQNITAAYLINNIEQSFFLRDSMPWGKYYSFQQFCEHILPYRFSTEKLVDWRKIIWDKLGDRIDTIKCDGIFENLGDYSNKLIYNPSHDIRSNALSPIMSIKEIFNYKIVTCEDFAIKHAAIVRALGIPSLYVHIPYFGNREEGHAFVACIDTTGILRKNNWYDKNGTRVGKAYSYFFSQKVQNDDDVNELLVSSIPFLFNKRFTDVTNLMFRTANYTIEYNNNEVTKNNIFLCVYNMDKWRIVDKGYIDNGKIQYTNFEKGVVYLPVYFNKKNSFNPLTLPFMIDEKGNEYLFEPDSSTPCTVGFHKDSIPNNIGLDFIPETEYEIFIWENKWKSLKIQKSSQSAIYFYDLPPNAVYRILPCNPIGKYSTPRIIINVNGESIWM